MPLPSEIATLIGNLPVEDAEKGLRVSVIPADISKAKQKDPEYCAFANAIRRSRPTLQSAYFSKSTAYLIYRTKVMKYQLPGSMKEEVTSFDRSKIMAPGEYQLAPVSPSKKQGAATPSSNRQRGTATNKRFAHRTIMVRGNE
jgi:hypothetical protein